jgi:hypothetical protein
MGYRNVALLLSILRYSPGLCRAGPPRAGRRECVRAYFKPSHRVEDNFAPVVPDIAKDDEYHGLVGR